MLIQESLRGTSEALRGKIEDANDIDVQYIHLRNQDNAPQILNRSGKYRALTDLPPK